jgi:rubrerythrin
MNSEENQHRLLQLYLEMELQMARLYELFAEDFPHHRDILKSLASEEREHASWIQYLQEQASRGKTHFVVGKLRGNTIETLNRYLSETISRHRRNPFDVVHAAAIILDLERSLIEKNVFRSFDGDSEEVSRILGILVESQEMHLKKVERFAVSVRGCQK